MSEKNYQLELSVDSAHDRLDGVRSIFSALLSIVLENTQYSEKNAELVKELNRALAEDRRRAEISAEKFNALAKARKPNADD